MKAKACIISALALALSAGMAVAQSGSGAPTKGVQKAPTTEAGKKCSADADAKNLHGKERQKFRRACIREFKKAPPAK